MTIVTLTGDNGLLQKAQNAGEQSKIAGAEEQIKLLYAEYQISKYAEGNTSAGDYLKEQLEKTYGEGNVDVISQEESIVLKVINNGESKFYEYNPSTGISKELQKGINYNGKTPSEIRPGDDITIVTEKFKVFAVENNTIKAMPYYNITLTDTPVQSKNAGTIAFASEYYWTLGEDEVNMDNINNSIQKYIAAYSVTINFFEEEVKAKAVKYSEITASGVTDFMRNPGRIGKFWTASSHPTSGGFIRTVYDTGGINGDGYKAKSIGVRPIIEIPIE